MKLISIQRQRLKADRCELGPLDRIKRGRAIAAQIAVNQHPVTGLRRGNGATSTKAVDVVGPTMQQHDHRQTINRPGLRVADVQYAGFDLLQCGQRRVLA